MFVEKFGPEPEGATPLSEEDYEGLLPGWLAHREDLNQVEAMNIGTARTKYLKRKLETNKVLDDLFVRRLHRDMYRDVWAWAGQYRKRDLNLGIDYQRVSVEVANLMADSQYWFHDDDPDHIDSVACEIHHRLVSIHPFVNGNGRMTRLFADVLLISKDRPAFQWGGIELTDKSAVRDAYIQALRLADTGDMSALLQFVRSNSAPSGR